MGGAVDFCEARADLSRLVERAAAGEEIVIAKGGEPKAKLVPYRAKLPPRQPANALGITYIAEDFDGPLPAEIQNAFEGKG